MSRPTAISLLLFSVLAPDVGSLEPPQPFGVGTDAAAALIASRDITVLPDGTGLPPGGGTARQGRLVYAAQCASCHGLDGTGQANAYPPIAGGQGSLTRERPMHTVGAYWPYATTAWDYIRRSMPYLTPGSLSVDEVYAVTAFVLHLDGVVGEDERMDEATLPAVVMPNRDGFVPDPRAP